MHLTFRNVNEAFYKLVSGIYDGSIPTVAKPSRVGEVLQIPEPVTVTYLHPRERVLFNPARDCNPFFHLYEALWMIRGEDLVEPLLEFNPRMADFSDNGTNLFGAYGYRWRRWFGYDQLRVIIEELRKNPNSRRCVLTMWDGGNGDDPACNDLDVAVNGGKDVPCNTHIYFSVRNESVRVGRKTGEPEEAILSQVDCEEDIVEWTQPVLDMTVCNRSNDLVWGMLGANVVHMSILQEYMADQIGVEVGVYNQFTNNLHVYTERWEPAKWLAAHTDEEYPETTPLGNMRNLEANVQAMTNAFRSHKRRDYATAYENMEQVKALDWRKAGVEWLQRREERYNAKTSTE